MKTSEVYNKLILQNNTPLGLALNVTENCQTLCTSMYAAHQISTLLPVLSSVVLEESSIIDYEALARSVEASDEAMDQLTRCSMEEAFLLAPRAFDKVAIAAYTLYRYGR